MLPQIAELEFITTDQQADLPVMGKSFLFDFKTGDFVLKDGKLVPVYDIEALKIWIEKCLRTEKYRFEVYKEVDYGITIEDLIIGYDYPLEFVKSEIKREVTEALTKHPLIQGLTDWNIEKQNPVLRVEFRVVLVNGVEFGQEVNW